MRPLDRVRQRDTIPVQREVSLSFLHSGASPAARGGKGSAWRMASSEEASRAHRRTGRNTYLESRAGIHTATSKRLSTLAAGGALISTRQWKATQYAILKTLDPEGVVGQLLRFGRDMCSATLRHAHRMSPIPERGLALRPGPGPGSSVPYDIHNK